MVQATVTLKVTPNELQMIVAALKWYGQGALRTVRPSIDLAPIDLAPTEGDARVATMRAAELCAEIGLK